MINLSEDLQQRKNFLGDFFFLAERVLAYLPNIISGFQDKDHYRIYYSEVAGTKKIVRPVNMNLFLSKPEELKDGFEKFNITLQSIKSGKRDFSAGELQNINSTAYTLQQSIGIGLDLLVNPNAARKHVGNRFEELIRAIFTEAGMANKRTVLQIPYETDAGNKIYKCENDLILSPYPEVRSTNRHLDEKEIVVGVKTTSKDRMGKMFIDKMLLERFVQHKQKVIGIFLNDVQRKQEDQISYTLVSGLFMVYTKFLVELEGIYYLDPPPNVYKEPFKNHMKTFGELLTQDVWKFLTS